MNRDATVKAIQVMQASLEGKPIQALNEQNQWEDCPADSSPAWHWATTAYRVKPEGPRTRWIVTDALGTETLYFHDPGYGLAVLETAAKFVEVMEDEVKPAYDAGRPSATIIPPSVRPLLRHFMVGDKGKTVGGWQYTVLRDFDQTIEVLHEGGEPSRRYEMIHDKNGRAGPAGEDHQLLTPEFG